MKFPSSIQIQAKNFCVHANNPSRWTEQEDKTKRNQPYLPLGENEKVEKLKNKKTLLQNYC